MWIHWVLYDIHLITTQIRPGFHIYTLERSFYLILNIIIVIRHIPRCVIQLYKFTSASPYLEHATTRLVSTKTCPRLSAQTTSSHAINRVPVSQSEARTGLRFGKLPREHLMNKWPTWLGPCTTSYGGPSYTQPLRMANPVITVLDDRYTTMESCVCCLCFVYSIVKHPTHHGVSIVCKR